MVVRTARGFGPTVTLLLTLGAVISGCGGGGGSGQTAAPAAADAAIERTSQPTALPNILLIMADDLGYNDLAINNANPDIVTPNMDRLAREGVRFTRHYAAPVCSPARAALLTGQYPERIGFTPDALGISPQVTTLAERLQQEGYRTWHIGKWHLGEELPGALPDRQGFDRWFGFLNQFQLAGPTAGGEFVPSRPRHRDPWLRGDRDPGRYYTGYVDDILTDRALAVLDELSASQKPWLMNLWYFAPHRPIQPSPEFSSRYPDTEAGRYRALVEQLDHNIGRVLAHLESLGVRQNTTVVVVSDNGGTNGEIDNNFPYYGEKGSLLEGGLRTPLIVSWARQPGIRGVDDTIVATMDLFPTLLESLDLDIPATLDGVSFYQLTQGTATSAARQLFWGLDNPLVLSRGILDQATDVRSVYGPLHHYFDIEPALYDLATDDTGVTQLASPDPLRRQSLERDYGDWHRQVSRVAIDSDVDASGRGTLTGMDFLRAPGKGGYTFGIAWTGSPFGTLVQQADLWRLSRSGNTVTAQFGDRFLSGEVADDPACHSVIVSGHFSRHSSFFANEDSMRLTLYIDGTAVDTLDIYGALDISQIDEPTRIGSGDASDSGRFLAPVILNVSLEVSPYWRAAELGQELCAQA